MLEKTKVILTDAKEDEYYKVHIYVIEEEKDGIK